MPKNTSVLPLIPLRGLVAFPSVVLHFDAGREKTVQAIQATMGADQLCFLSAQRDPRKVELEPGDVYDYGTIARLKQVLRLPGDSVRVLVEGISRGKIINIVSDDEYVKVEVEEFEEDALISQELAEALQRKLSAAYEKYAYASGKSSGEILLSFLIDDNLSRQVDVIAASTLVKNEDKQAIIEELDVRERTRKLLSILARETEIQKLEGKIHQQVKKNIEKSQREYFLREQLRVIRRELGDEDSYESEIEELGERLALLDLPDEVRKKADKELKRLSMLPASSHEAPGIRSYLDWLSELPWGKYTQDDLDLARARDVLDADHYGLKKVKDRIIEHLAVCSLKKDVSGTILCFVGPPGVGKTSVAASIARSVNRNFTRISLGGVRDEAEIRGHRRTYIGAIPGRIITAVKLAGSMNPVILFDEIDKLSSDYKGDPASAMLEVLDSAQNYAFRDHYMEIPLDLSKIMFITTANSVDTIPKALLDRMEVIELSSYTEEEKVQICARHLLPKQLEKHGIKKNALKLHEETISAIVNQYTREAGVRNLERRVGDICRKAACEIIEGRKTITVNSKKLREYLGAPKFKRSSIGRIEQVGVAVGLAWTSVGGETLDIEVTPMKGSGKFEITGQIGSVMSESAHAAFTYVRAHAAKLGVDPSFNEHTDLHIHIPEGAIPKDGPSAGITLAIALISALSGIPVLQTVAMTGEITLHGRVLPVGGLKEKILAAQRMGIHKVILPAQNKPDVEDMPGSVTEGMEIVYADELPVVIRNALSRQPKHYVSLNEILPPPEDIVKGALKS